MNRLKRTNISLRVQFTFFIRLTLMDRNANNVLRVEYNLVCRTIPTYNMDFILSSIKTIILLLERRRDYAVISTRQRYFIYCVSKVHTEEIE